MTTLPATDAATGPEEDRRLVFVVFGPGGVGKGTLVGRLMSMRDGLYLSRSWTTRPRRPSEAPDAYVFASRAEFLARVGAGGFLEFTEFAGNGHLYGTPTLECPAGEDIVLEIEINGARQVKSIYPEAVLILVATPSRQVQEQRLRARGDDDESVRRRLAVGAEEELDGRRMADFVVVNDDLERAAEELASIIDRCRQLRAHTGTGTAQDAPHQGDLGQGDRGQDDLGRGALGRGVLDQGVPDPALGMEHGRAAH